MTYKEEREAYNKLSSELCDKDGKYKINLKVITPDMLSTNFIYLTSETSIPQMLQRFILSSAVSAFLKIRRFLKPFQHKVYIILYSESSVILAVCHLSFFYFE